MVTGAAEFFWYVSGQVFQTLTGNAHTGLIHVGGSDATVMVGKILHESLGVIRSGRKDSRSVIRALYRNERSVNRHKARASSG